MLTPVRLQHLLCILAPLQRSAISLSIQQHLNQQLQITFGVKAKEINKNDHV